MSIAYFAPWTIAAVVGRVAVVVGEATTIYAFLPHRAIVVGGAVRDAYSLAVRIVCGATWLLAIFIGRAIRIIGAGCVFDRLFGLTCSAHANAAFAVSIAHANP